MNATASTVSAFSSVTVTAPMADHDLDSSTDDDVITVECWVCRYWENDVNTTQCGNPDCPRRHPGTS